MEIWISEAQERMVIFVPPEKVDTALELFAGENVEATVIGRTTNDKSMRLRYKGRQVGELDMDFLHNGLPPTVRKAIIPQPQTTFTSTDSPSNLTPFLLQILAAPNVCSKEWVIRQYDHEVQAGSVIKPLVGVADDGPGDASITRPRLDSHRGIILANGLNPRYGLIDPYWMAASAIDEAVRNVIAVGGSLDRTALLDNFCWGNCDKPDRLGGLVQAAQACYDIASAFGTPFISGKDSLNNEFKTEDGESIAIPPTLLISAISVMGDARKAVSMDLKEPNNVLYILGITKNEMGGSHYYAAQGIESGSVPIVDAKVARSIFVALSSAIEAGLVRACHDCSEGGIGVAIAEIAFAGGLGAKIDLKDIPKTMEVSQNDIALFSESNSRFIVEVPPSKQASFEEKLTDLPFARIGSVSAEPRLIIRGLDGQQIVDAELHLLKESWQKTLRW